MLDGLRDMELAFFKKSSTLVTGSKVVVGDDVIDPVQHTPVLVIGLALGFVLLVEFVKQGIHRLNFMRLVNTYIQFLQG